MQKQSDAHKGLSLMFAWDAVPTCLIMDNSKEQHLVSSDGKQEADCWIKQMEPYSPWSNFAEVAVCELKKGFARRMLNAHVPKHLWDTAWMEAFIRTHMLDHG